MNACCLMCNKIQTDFEVILYATMGISRAFAPYYRTADPHVSLVSIILSEFCTCVNPCVN